MLGALQYIAWRWVLVWRKGQEIYWWVTMGDITLLRDLPVPTLYRIHGGARVCQGENGTCKQIEAVLCHPLVAIERSNLNILRGSG